MKTFYFEFTFVVVLTWSPSQQRGCLAKDFEVRARRGKVCLGFGLATTCYTHCMKNKGQTGLRYIDLDTVKTKLKGQTCCKGIDHKIQFWSMAATESNKQEVPWRHDTAMATGGTEHVERLLTCR